MSVHKRKDGAWVVRYRDETGSNKQRTFGKGRIAKREAAAFDLDVAAKKARQEIITGPGDVYFDKLAKGWILHKKARGRNMGWISDWAGILEKYLLKALCRKPAREYTEEEIHTLVESKWGTSSPTTRHRYTGYLKSIFKYGQDRGLIDRNPLALWAMPKQKKKAVPLTLPDLERIMRHAAPHLRWALTVAWNLGTRPGQSELLALRWTDVDFEAGTVHIGGTKTSDSDRVVPVHADFLADLREAKAQAESDHIIEYKGRPIKKIRSALGTACRKAGIEYHVRMYDVRHLYGSILLTGGADLEAVSKLMGHSSTKMTADTYYHAQKGEKQRAVQMLPQIGKPKAGKVVNLHDKK